MPWKKMLVRLRRRGGQERLEVDLHTTVGTLWKKIEELHVAVAEQTLSRDQKVLISKTPRNFQDVADPSVHLSSLDISHSGERTFTIPPVNVAGLFGTRTTIDDLIARQTRIEQSRKPLTTPNLSRQKPPISSSNTSTTP